ncbi:hypothetical protein D1007_19725 [Hordeum vulgare]|nr:hypothetical protein D1007_19725 [Hordeum vulgare]
MIRKTNDVQEGRTNEVQEGSGVINDDPKYNPKEDEFIDGEEVDDVLVEKSVKKEERKGDEFSTIDLFKATHNSKKRGFSEPIKIAILDMEKMKDAPVPEGEEPKFVAEIIDQLLKTEVKQNTFKVERSKLQAEVMQEELAAMKMKAEEAEAACEKEFELLRKKSQEHDENLAHLRSSM